MTRQIGCRPNPRCSRSSTQCLQNHRRGLKANSSVPIPASLSCLLLESSGSTRYLESTSQNRSESAEWYSEKGDCHATPVCYGAVPRLFLHLLIYYSPNLGSYLLSVGYCLGTCQSTLSWRTSGEISMHPSCLLEVLPLPVHVRSCMRRGVESGCAASCSPCKPSYKKTTQ